jgi:hypothetical protein
VAYCLDANVLIETHHRLFPMDVAPGFWDALDEAGVRGDVFVIHEVFREVTRGTDELAKWLKARGSYVRDQRGDGETNVQFALVGKTVAARVPKYKPAAVPDFFGCADPWLIAYCAAHGHVVVTQEIAEPKRLAKVKIPDVCGAMGVRYINAVELLRTLGVRLVLR